MTFDIEAHLRLSNPPTDATVMAVELLLCRHIIKEVALQTRVRPKLHSTAAATLCYRLLEVTECTYHLLYLFAV